MKHAIGSLVLLSIITISNAASGRPFRVDDLPSAPNGCETCHLGGGGGPLNGFGQQVRTLLVSPVSTARAPWASLCSLDADGDGHTNGDELGDPGCSWQEGDAATTAVSDPATPTESPNAQTSAVRPKQDLYEGEGGCSAHGTSGLNVPIFIILLLGLGFVRTRTH